MRAGDLDDAARLYLKAYRVKWTDDGAKGYLRKFFEFDPTKCWVAVEGAKVFGVVLAYSFEKASGPVLFIQELFVDPENRNQGLGKRLVANLRESCAPSSVKIKPLVKADTSVLNFYNSLGFEKDIAVSFSFDE